MPTAKFARFDKLVRFGTLSGGGGSLPIATADSATITADASTVTADGAQGVAVSPRSILGASLIAWWTADRADLITLNGAEVTSWKDVVAGYDAVQAVSAARPLYSASSFNGAPALTFDGADDELTSIDAALLAALPGGATPCEMWGVTQQNALAADATVRILASYGGATSTSRRGLERAVATGVVRGRITTGTGGGSSAKTSTVVDFTSRHVLRGRWSATDHAVSVDGSAEESSGLVPATTLTRLRIGAISNTAAANFWSGLCRDLLITGPLNAEQIAAINAWALPRRML